MFVDIEFPPRIAFGAQRYAAWVTTVSTVRSGSEFRNQEHTRARHRYDVSFSVRTNSDYAEIQAHHHTMRGRLKTFPFEDFLDHEVSVAQGVVLEYDDSDSTLQLAKRYGSGSDSYDREITRPKTGVQVFRERSAVTTNITGQTDVDLETGRIEIDPGVFIEGDILSWSGEFYVPCRYDTDELPAAAINKQPRADGELFVEVSSIMVIEDLGDFSEP